MHSGAAGYVVAQRFEYRRGPTIDITVGDSGRGIRQGLASNPALRRLLESDEAALLLALQDGVSGVRDAVRGLRARPGELHARQIADYATNFATREIARRILSGMQKEINGGYTRLVLDFEHVVVVSPSFASEVVRQTELLLEGSSVSEAILSGCEPSVYLVFREVLDRPSLQSIEKELTDSGAQLLIGTLTAS